MSGARESAGMGENGVAELDSRIHAGFEGSRSDVPGRPAAAAELVRRSRGFCRWGFLAFGLRLFAVKLNIWSFNLSIFYDSYLPSDEGIVRV